MKYCRIGRSGLQVSEICLGAMTFGHGVDQQEANRMVDLSMDAGVNFFDTADAYGDGQSEIMLGNALKGRRRGVVVATKFHNAMGSGPNDSGMSRVHIMNAIEDSLARLNAVSRPPERYPKAFEQAMKARREQALRMPSLE